ncbi:MBL fold metallo-hydrolase [Bradyrhizobium sp. KB893862 SZCCT0404]|uniref:MBL fold metallo-hydrolase n=1 Tax=Bradyrhizobium sp. KB893862 SZCCT0404 TaxID=2807672 RepID=UPI001BAB3197|nr:MBL fold metallo-hydrolase [Bradyrhizobium sp. KB893862 SZCCT0404]
MKFTQVRNATVIVEYGEKRFLVDPMLSKQGAFPGFEGTLNSHRANPTVELPMPMDRILDVDAVIVTHLHPDHWDEAARDIVPKTMPMIVQNEKDAGQFKAQGFVDVRILGEKTDFGGISLTKTPGQHGTDEAYKAIGEILGDVCGVVFRHPKEKTLYIAGDTIWNKYVEQSLKKHVPDVVVLNCGDAQVIGLGSIIMGSADVYEVCQAAPRATIIASHMEAVNHVALSRAELRAFLDAKGMSQRVLVPEDGASLAL